MLRGQTEDLVREGRGPTDQSGSPDGWVLRRAADLGIDSDEAMSDLAREMVALTEMITELVAERAQVREQND